MWNSDYHDFGPRLGFAYRLTNKPTLVLRGGFGIYYERLSGELAGQKHRPDSVFQLPSGCRVHRMRRRRYKCRSIRRCPIPRRFQFLFPELRTAPFSVAAIDETSSVRTRRSTTSTSSINSPRTICCRLATSIKDYQSDGLPGIQPGADRHSRKSRERRDDHDSGKSYAAPSVCGHRGAARTSAKRRSTQTTIRCKPACISDSRRAWNSKALTRFPRI